MLVIAICDINLAIIHCRQSCCSFSLQTYIAFIMLQLPCLVTRTNLKF